jgi:hypothetical protein
MIYLLTATGLSPGGSTHLHTNNTWNNTNNNRTTLLTTDVEECGPCPVFASFTLAFVLQLRKSTEYPQSFDTIGVRTRIVTAVARCVNRFRHPTTTGDVSQSCVCMNQEIEIKHLEASDLPISKAYIKATEPIPYPQILFSLC